MTEPKDIHRELASKLFNVPYDAVTPEQRDRAKTIGFAAIYANDPHNPTKKPNRS